MPYITNTDIAAYLGVTLTSAQEATLATIIPGVEQEAERATNRRWGVSTPQTEHFDGGTRIFFPAISPIASITSVTVDGQAVPANEIHNYGAHVELDYVPSFGRQTVTIVYVPSSPLPEDVKLALIRWAASLMKGATQGDAPVKRVQVGDGEIEYFGSNDQSSSVPSYVEQVLSRHRLRPV